MRRKSDNTKKNKSKQKGITWRKSDNTKIKI